MGFSFEMRGSTPSGPKEPERLEDGRMRCVYCGRYFSDERIEKHQVVVGWKGEWLDG